MKTIRKLFLIGVGVIWLFSQSIPVIHAQTGLATSSNYTGEVRFEHLTVEDGLPNSTVLSVLQDQQGFMWFATADGVARYDGYSFTTFRHDTTNNNSLSNNNTFALLESKDGLIWIGTDPGGLNVYNPETGQFKLYTHDKNDPTSLVDDSIWSLMEANDGSIWVGTRGGLSHLDRDSGIFKNYMVNADNPHALSGAVIYRIYQDHSGVVWAATRSGINRYNPASDDFTVFKNNPDDPTSISHSNVWAMLEDKEGNFWVGTRGGGLNLFDRSTGKFKAYKNDVNDPASLSSNNIWNIFEDSTGNLWVTTENGGINLFDKQNGSFTRFMNNPNDPGTISNNDIYWMTEDRSGVLWITSRYGGVNKLFPALSRFNLFRNVPGNANSLNSNSVYSVLSEPQDGYLWIGTFGGGINRYDRKTKTMTVYKNDPNDEATLSNDKIQNIFRDEKGILWATTSGGGLNRMDPQTGKFSAFRLDTKSKDSIGSNFLTTIRSAGEDRLWIGTLGFGLDLFNTKTGKLEKAYMNDPDDPDSLAEDTVYDLAVDQAGQVWIATARGGLELLDPQSGKITHHQNDPANPNSILGDAVYAIYLDENDGIIWAATANGLSGLNLKTQQWQNYTKRDGLPSDNIVGVQPGRKKELWVSTGKGISQFSMENKTFTNYDVRDGLQGDQFEIASSSHGPDGEIFFGGSNGLTAFHPEQIVKNSYLPPVVFTDFELFNQPVPVGSNILPKPIEKTKQIILNHDQSVFTIKFAALNFQFSAKNLYQYKMEGFDKDWSPASAKHEVTYTNLPSGEYTFMVRAANNDGVWNKDYAEMVVIKVLPPWWETWWFRILAGLGLIFLALFGVQMRIRNVDSVNRTLEKRVMERTQELEEAQEKLSLANSELKTQLDEITNLEKIVRDMAIHDALTGLYNRHYLMDRLKAEFSRAQREHYQIACLMLDIDHFKKVNDSYGHQFGDLILKKVGDLLNSSTRQNDIACRYGGEEFVVFMPHITVEHVMERADFFRKTFEQSIPEFEDQKVFVTISIGVAIFPDHGSNQEQILYAADTAMYQAKNAGRNKVVLYTPNNE